MPGEETAPFSESPQSIPPDPAPIEPRGEAPPPIVFRQGAHPPFAVRWYGITSLFGHLRNFVARAIASESVDSRDWMRPNSPDNMLKSALSILEGSAYDEEKVGETLLDSLNRPVWIDFVADTGDDRDVSGAVGKMVTGTYTVETANGPKVLPRGELLLFGGDIAYPVATADEIWKRLISPWNGALRELRASDRKRLLLGVPGNHDWYDGLDGFGRLFRRRLDEPFKADDHETSARIVRKLRQRRGRKMGLTARALHLDEVGGLVGQLLHFLRSARAFFRGVGVKRRRRLVLRGYEPAQEASYFVLPLAKGFDLWGADRQLGRMDFRQRAFFKQRRREAPHASIFFLSADPATVYGERNDPGARMLSACKLNLDRDRIFYISGDFHHYERRAVGPSMHIIAGGGGAFLHGTRIPPSKNPPAKAYPDAATSRALALQVPWKLMIGRAGLLVHLLLALVASMELGASLKSEAALKWTSATLSVVLWLVLFLIANRGSRPKLTAAIASVFGGALGILPMILKLALSHAGAALAGDGAVMIVSALAGSFLFGTFLTLVALLGIEHQQAFTVLGHPGFKHFVRLCVHPNGLIEGFTIGKDDALAPGQPKLIDSFTWRAHD